MDTPSVSRVGVVTDALVAAFGAIAGVVVLDGPTPETLTKTDGIAVGVTDNAFDIQLSQFTRLGVGPMDERINIYCALWSWHGETTVKPLRDRCVDLLNQIRTILANDQTVGGVCDSARLGDAVKAYPTQTTEGAVFDVGFTIVVSAGI